MAGRVVGRKVDGTSVALAGTRVDVRTGTTTVATTSTDADDLPEMTVVVIDDHTTFADLLALGLKHEHGLSSVVTATTVAPTWRTSPCASSRP